MICYYQSDELAMHLNSLASNDRRDAKQQNHLERPHEEPALHVGV